MNKMYVRCDHAYWWLNIEVGAGLPLPEGVMLFLSPFGILNEPGTSCFFKFLHYSLSHQRNAMRDLKVWWMKAGMMVCLDIYSSLLFSQWSNGSWGWLQTLASWCSYGLRAPCGLGLSLLPIVLPFGPLLGYSKSYQQWATTAKF